MINAHEIDRCKSGIDIKCIFWPGNFLKNIEQEKKYAAVYDK